MHRELDILALSAGVLRGVRKGTVSLAKTGEPAQPSRKTPCPETAVPDSQINLTEPPHASRASRYSSRCPHNHLVWAQNRCIISTDCALSSHVRLASPFAREPAELERFFWRMGDRLRSACPSTRGSKCPSTPVRTDGLRLPHTPTPPAR